MPYPRQETANPGNRQPGARTAQSRAPPEAAANANELEDAIRVGDLVALRKQRALGGRRAAAFLGDLEPALHRPRALKQLLDLVQLARRQRAHLLRHAGPGVDAVDQLLDLGELEAGALGHADEPELAEDVRVIAALTVHAPRGRQQVDALVVANRRRRDAGAPGDLADGQFGKLIQVHASP